MKQQWKNHKPLLAALATLAVLLAGVVLIWLAQVYLRQGYFDDRP